MAHVAGVSSPVVDGTEMAMASRTGIVHAAGGAVAAGAGGVVAATAKASGVRVGDRTVVASVDRSALPKRSTRN